MQAEFLIESDLDTSSFCRHVLREPRHTPALEHTPGIPKPPNEKNLFIDSWLVVGTRLSFWDGNFSEAMLNFRNVVQSGPLPL